MTSERPEPPYPPEGNHSHFPPYESTSESTTQIYGVSTPLSASYSASTSSPATSHQISHTHKSRRGFGTAFLTGLGAGLGLMVAIGIIAVVISMIAVSSIISLVHSVDSSTNSSSIATTTIFGSDSAHHTLYALSISGTITASAGTTFSAATHGYEIADQIDQLEADSADGLILLMDTPGGSITGSRAMADAITRYQERTGKKVIAFVQSLSASGGMYTMAPADYIIADYGTMVGSIGVIMGPLTRYRDVVATTGSLLQSGVETTGGITSEYLTQGKGKDFGNPFRDMTDEERANYTHNIEVEYDKFVSLVSQYRNIPADTIRNDLGAYLFDAATAQEKGLVDEVMNRPDAFAKAAELNGVDPSDIRVITPATPSKFEQLLGASGRVKGHNIPLSRNEGIMPDADICTAQEQVLSYVGSITDVCG